VGKLTVHGQVLGNKTNAGLPNITVEVRFPLEREYDGLASTVTDGAGAFQLTIAAPDVLIRPATPPKCTCRLSTGATVLSIADQKIGWEGRDGTAVKVSLVAQEADAPPPPPGSTEVVLHELGESIGAAIASVQDELGRYPNTLGAYLLDEVALEIPVAMRVDQLGQVMTTVVEDAGPAGTVGRLKFQIRPVLGASAPPPVSSGQSLADLGLLSKDALSRLQELRIFSVDDLLRVGRNATGRSRLESIGLDVPVAQALEEATAAATPALPDAVKAVLRKQGIRTLKDFAKQDAATLARALSEQLGEAVSEADVKRWQQAVAGSVSQLRVRR